MEVHCYLASVIIILIGLQAVTSNRDCDSSESVSCREEFENLKEFQNRYQYASDNHTLNEMCRKQHLALNCVNSFAEECLTEGEQEVYKTLIKGSDAFFDSFCFEDSQLRKRYLIHSGCIKTITTNLDKCTKEYEYLQRRLDESERNNDALKQRTCCLYFENIYCSANVTSAVCGEDAAELVEELWRLLGGTYLNELCQPFSEYDFSSCSPISEGTRTDMHLLSLLFPMIYSAISYYMR